jgi:hypothetical protein
MLLASVGPGLGVLFLCLAASVVTLIDVMINCRKTVPIEYKEWKEED